MKTFNLTSYENGRVIATVKAETQNEAQTRLESKGYDCQNDYFLETVEDANKWESLQQRPIYIDEIR